MITLNNIQNSFLQFGEPCDYLLPVKTENDIKFQVPITGEDKDETDALLEGDMEVFVVGKDSVIEDDTELDAAVIGNGDPVSADIFWRVSQTKAVAYFGEAFSDFESIPLETCFKLLLRVTVGEVKYYFSSNCFYRTNEDYTSTVEYSCSQDSYGFYYCDQYVPNKIRLPFFLSRPQYKTDRSIYYKSNGVARITKSVTRRELEGQTDHMPDEYHQKFVAALEHEVVFMESARYTGEVREAEDYNISWAEINDYMLAPASFKVIATPYSSVLNNCADCQEYEELSCAVEVLIRELTQIENDIYVQWMTGATSAVKFLVKLDDNAPVVVTTFSTQFNNVSTGEHTVTITPVCVINNNDVTGTEVSSTVTVTEPEDECAPVNFTMTTLPDARVGVPYDFIIFLSGTSPFYLSAATKPTWMNISIVSNTVRLNGTPFSGADGNGQAVSISVGNCQNDIQTQSTTINVIGNVGVPIMNVRIGQYNDDGICTQPKVTVYLEPGNYAIAPGLKVYQDVALTTSYSLKWLLDQDGNIWRIAFGILQTNSAHYDC